MFCATQWFIVSVTGWAGSRLLQSVPADYTLRSILVDTYTVFCGCDNACLFWRDMRPKSEFLNFIDKLFFKKTQEPLVPFFTLLLLRFPINWIWTMYKEYFQQFLYHFITFKTRLAVCAQWSTSRDRMLFLAHSNIIDVSNVGKYGGQREQRQAEGVYIHS